MPRKKKEIIPTLPMPKGFTLLTFSYEGANLRNGSPFIDDTTGVLCVFDTETERMYAIIPNPSSAGKFPTSLWELMEERLVQESPAPHLYLEGQIERCYDGKKVIFLDDVETIDKEFFHYLGDTRVKSFKSPRVEVATFLCSTPRLKVKTKLGKRKAPTEDEIVSLCRDIIRLADAEFVKFANKRR